MRSRDLNTKRVIIIIIAAVLLIVLFGIAVSQLVIYNMYSQIYKIMYSSNTASAAVSITRHIRSEY